VTPIALAKSGASILPRTRAAKCASAPDPTNA
jgi:hypothetical protein